MIRVELISGMLFLSGCGSGSDSADSASTSPPSVAASAPTYCTSVHYDFPLAENPISENGTWINGGTAGLDWSNVQTTVGLAFGTQSGKDACPILCYNDSTVILGGPWNSDQSLQATVF